MLFKQQRTSLKNNSPDEEAEENTNNDQELLLSWLQGKLPKNSVLIIVIKEKINLNNKLVKQIKKVGRVADFTNDTNNNLNKITLSKKIRQKLEQSNKTITTKACNYLIDRTDSNMYEISSALDKIINLIGNQKEITDKEIKLVVANQNFNTVFDLIDAIGSKSLPKALKSLHEVVLSGEPGVKINSLITRQLRLVLQAKLLYRHQEDLRPVTSRTNYSTFRDNILAPLKEQLVSLLPEAKETNILKQNPYAAYKIFQSVSKFTEDELIVGLEKSLEVDKELKTSGLPHIAILEELVFDLSNRSS